MLAAFGTSAPRNRRNGTFTSRSSAGFSDARFADIFGAEAGLDSAQDSRQLGVQVQREACGAR